MFDVVKFVGEQQPLFTNALSDEKVLWAKESQFAIQAFQKNSYLATTAEKNIASAQNAIINVAAIGITLNPAAKLAYLVPRDGGVCLDISYMGLMHIAQRTGSILWGQCRVVYENDSYESTGIDSAPTHSYNAFGERGNPVGAYCVVKTPDGSYLTEEMSRIEILSIRDRSQSWKSGKSSPWKTDELEMWRKTVVKRASKYWPKSDRLDVAIDNLNTEGGEGVVTDVAPEPEKIINPIESISFSLNRQGKSESDFFNWASKVVKRTVASFDDLSSQEIQQFARKLEAVK
jgi:recombination protein RecT